MTYVVGDRLPLVLSPPLDRLRIAYMAVAMRDPNPIHIEDEYARESGLPGVIGHGTFTIAYLAAAITQVVGVDALRRFDFTIIAPLVLGDVVTVSAEVTGVEASGPTTGPLISVAVSATTQNGNVVGRGSAAFLSKD